MTDTEAYRTTLARLEAEQAKADAMTEKRKAAIAAITELIEMAQGVETPTSLVTGWTGNEGIPKGLTMKDAAIWVLRKARRPLRVREIYDAMLGAGYKYPRSYESFRGSLTPTLDRNKTDFRRVATGLYYLADAAYENEQALNSVESQGLLING